MLSLSSRQEQGPTRPFRPIVAERVPRRRFPSGSGAGVSADAASGFVRSPVSGAAHAQAAESGLTFTELKRILDQIRHVADG
jgi:secreted PhoX family phosphatase